MTMRTFRVLRGFGSAHYPPDRSAHTTLILSADRHLAVHCRRVLAIQLHWLEARLANWSGERTDAWRFLQVVNKMHGVCPILAGRRRGHHIELAKDGVTGPVATFSSLRSARYLKAPANPWRGMGTTYTISRDQTVGDHWTSPIPPLHREHSGEAKVPPVVPRCE